MSLRLMKLVQVLLARYKALVVFSIARFAVNLVKFHRGSSIKLGKSVIVYAHIVTKDFAMRCDKRDNGRVSVQLLQIIV